MRCAADAKRVSKRWCDREAAREGWEDVTAEWEEVKKWKSRRIRLWPKCVFQNFTRKRRQDSKRTRVQFHRKLMQSFFFLGGGLNLLMQLLFLALVELFFKQLNGCSF